MQIAVEDNGLKHISFHFSALTQIAGRLLKDVCSCFKVKAKVEEFLKIKKKVPSKCFCTVCIITREHAFIYWGLLPVFIINPRNACSVRNVLSKRDGSGGP